MTRTNPPDPFLSASCPPSSRRAWVACLLGLAPVFLCGQERVSPSLTLDAAVLQSLRSSPVVRLEQTQVDLGEGILLETRGAFDWTVNAGVSAALENRFTTPQPPAPPPDFEVIEEDTVALEGGVSRLFRNGVRISPNFAVVLLEDNRRLAEGAGESNLNLDLLVPLLRDSGTETVAAGEMAAEANLVAARRFFEFQLSRQALLTLTRYWELVSAGEQVEILKQIFQRADSLRKGVADLVEDQILAPADLLQAEANAFERQGLLARATLEYQQARYSFGLELGLSPTLLATPPEPAESLPILEEADLDFSAFSEADWIGFALDHRPDRLAIRENQRAREFLVTAARRNLRPRLDLSLRVGMVGIDRGSNPLSPFTENTEGPNFQGGLSLDWPVENRSRRGRLDQRLAEAEALRFEGNRLDQFIASEVLSALEAVRTGGLEAIASQKAAAAFFEAADLEQKRFQVGDADILDILQLEDRYLQSQINAIASKGRLAIAIGRLRFAAGAVFRELDPEDGTFTLEDLTDPFVIPD